ncbi:M50 family metallopeptidase [Actinomycetaceae bacterium L2_0104]
MNWSDAWSALLSHLRASFGAQAVAEQSWMVWAVLAAVLVLVATPVWTHVRQIVTVVHELGHAVVGILCGRKFTGFVINRDMSGHTVTSGRPRGPGIVLTTLAGYPMPSIVGAAMVAAAMAGRAQLVLLIAMVLIVVALIRSRSLYTVLALLALLVAGGLLWWSENFTLAALVVLAVGVLLLIGGWRQFGSVLRRGGNNDDPRALASLTILPTWMWNAIIFVLMAAPTWWAASSFLPIAFG